MYDIRELFEHKQLVAQAMKCSCIVDLKILLPTNPEINTLRLVKGWCNTRLITLCYATSNSLIALSIDTHKKQPYNE